MSDNKYRYRSDPDHEYEDTYELEDGDQPIHLHIDKRRCTQFKCESQDQIAFCVPLSFDQELVGGTGGGLVALSTIAANVDNIRGVLKLKFNRSLSKVAYALYVFNATGYDNRIIAAHLHIGAANQNGNVVVDLFNGPPRNVNGPLVKGIIDNRSIIINSNSQNINTITSLYQAIRDGTIYANVHSQRHPDGVIRGQIYLKQS